jgi:hypothetical protein
LDFLPSFVNQLLGGTQLMGFKIPIPAQKPWSAGKNCEVLYHAIQHVFSAALGIDMVLTLGVSINGATGDPTIVDQ